MMKHLSLEKEKQTAKKTWASDPTRFANETMKATGTNTTPKSSFLLDCQIFQDQFEWSSNLALEMRSVSFPSSQEHLDRG